MKDDNMVDYDLESPKSQQQPPDEISVTTHNSDSDHSDSSPYDSLQRRRQQRRKILFVALLALVLGLAAGLGLGLGLRDNEKAVSPPNTLVENSDSNIAEEEEPELYEPEQPNPEEDKPAFGGMTIGSPSSPQTVSWPELVGLPAEEAKKIIEDEGRGYTVVIVPPGGATTKDLREDRVFLFTNDEGFVERVPRPGR